MGGGSHGSLNVVVTDTITSRIDDSTFGFTFAFVNVALNKRFSKGVTLVVHKKQDIKER